MVNKPVEVAEEGMCWSEEIKLVVAAFLLRESGEELATSSSGEQGGKFHDVPAKVDEFKCDLKEK